MAMAMQPGRKARPPLTAAKLEEMALNYVGRFATSRGCRATARRSTNALPRQPRTRLMASPMLKPATKPEFPVRGAWCGLSGVMFRITR